MTEKELKLHTLLQRQLNRLGLGKEIMPTSQDQWEDFLAHINRGYQDADKERYLLERSMEISSHELLELNKKLEDAQEIAHMGYWIYDCTDDKIFWSKETYHLFELNPSEDAPSLERIYELISDEDRGKVRDALNRTIATGIPFEVELKIRNINGDLRWHYAKGLAETDSKQGNMSLPAKRVSGIVLDITDLKNAEQQMNTAREAGMAEVATSILHNIGNVLNSVIVSTSMIKDLFKEGYLKKLILVSETIKEHINLQDNYLINDPKGKLLPDYLLQLTKLLNENNQKINLEIQNLDTHIQHINDIVLIQNDLSRLSNGMVEKVFLPEIIDLSIRLSLASAAEKGIEIIKQYNESIFITLDKSKLLQILVNLLRNSKDALKASTKKEPKQIKITLQKNENSIAIIVQDNGIGIPKDNIGRLFTFGFTTKEHGHGFGLHGSAISAKNMGGNLKVESKGIEQGATFSLELPLHVETKKEGATHHAEA